MIFLHKNGVTVIAKEEANFYGLNKFDKLRSLTLDGIRIKF